MSELDIVREMFDELADLEEMGCEVTIRDPEIRAAYECFKKTMDLYEENEGSALSAGSAASQDHIKVYNERSHIRIIIGSGPKAESSAGEFVCDVKALQTAAQAVMKQAPFMLKNPYMFAGCAVEI